MSAPYRFLVLDDDADLRFLNRRALEKAFPGCHVIEADTCELALTLVTGVRVDAALADHQLQGESGLTCVPQLRASGVSGPIIMVTSNENPALRDEALAVGAAAVFAGGNADFVPFLREALGAS